MLEKQLAPSRLLDHPYLDAQLQLMVKVRMKKMSTLMPFESKNLHLIVTESQREHVICLIVCIVM